MATDAEIRKRFTQKVGYENALDFDPVNGVVKFGSYEAFVKDLGIAPQRQEYKFQDYLKNVTALGTGTRQLAGLGTADREKALRAQFERDVNAGTVPEAQDYNQYTGAAMKRESQTGLVSGYRNSQPAPPAFRQVSRLGPDSFAVDSYEIPSDQTAGFNLLNEISRRAVGLSKSVKANRNNDALRQNQQDAAAQRQGRAATVLSGINT